MKTVSIRYDRILFCTDFSENADFAFHYALAAALRSRYGTLHILHVIPEPEAQFWRTYLYEVDNVEEKAQQAVQQKIRDSYLTLIPEQVPYKVELRVGKAAEEILNYARQIDADLIVMGREGSSGIGKALFGNVTEKIARKAECPVLIIPYSFEKKKLTETT
ncbi:MAG: universal stress protein [candidate division KSB1 bacterium]|nr:universal stress protein [candidate division KSB1 bacterium]MDZ7346141.1 universal stress protein [candidate division KSB1 bacterium]